MSQAFKTISSASNPKLRKAVDWKLFELSANLIVEDVTNEDFDEACLWFMKRNAEEVVEERFTAGFCGFPLCKNTLKRGHHNSSSSAPRYRIDYDRKKIYEIEKSDNYCSVTCLQKSEFWQGSLDTISAVSRPIARTLILNTPVITSNNIDDVLSVISPGSVPVSKASALSPTATRNQSHRTFNDTDSSSLNNPPTHTHPSITSTGQLAVDIVDGRPVLMDASTIEQPASGNTKGMAISSPPTSSTKQQPSVDELLQTMKALQMKYDMVPQQPKLPAPAIKKMTRKNSNVNVQMSATATVEATPPVAPEPPVVIDSFVKEETKDQKVLITNEESQKKDRKTVVWNLAEDTINTTNRPHMSSNNLIKNSFSKPKAPPTAAMGTCKVLSLTVVERPASEPMSLAAMQLKREPAGAIEGFVPSSFS